MLLQAIPPSLLLQPDAIGGWSVRDLLAHFVAHEQRAVAEIAAARRGERLAIDPNGTSEFNAGAVFAWALLQPAEALAAWDRSYRRVVGLVEELSEADFAPGCALEQVLADTVDGALASVSAALRLSAGPFQPVRCRVRPSSDASSHSARLRSGCDRR